MSLRAKLDALEDIAQEELLPAYFGSASILDAEDGLRFVVNIIVEYDDLFYRSIGAAYMDVVKSYPSDDGYVVLSLQLEETVVYVDPEAFNHVEDDSGR